MQRGDRNSSLLLPRDRNYSNTSISTSTSTTPLLEKATAKAKQQLTQSTKSTRTPHTQRKPTTHSPNPHSPQLARDPARKEQERDRSQNEDEKRYQRDQEILARLEHHLFGPSTKSLEAAAKSNVKWYQLTQPDIIDPSTPAPIPGSRRKAD